MKIAAEVKSSTTALISWQQPPIEDQNGPIIYYSLIVTDLTFGFEDIEVNVTSLNYTVNNLEEYTTYSCIVAAVSPAGIGPYSTSLNFRTL